MKKKIKIILIGIVILIIIIFIYIKDSQNISGTKLPGYNVTTERNNTNQSGSSKNTPITLTEVTPPNNNNIDTKYIKFIFSNEVNVDDFTINITPKIDLDKEVSPSVPNMLVISPVTIWQKDINYKITIKNTNLKEPIVYNTKFSVKPPRE